MFLASLVNMFFWTNQSNKIDIRIVLIFYFVNMICAIFWFTRLVKFNTK